MAREYDISIEPLLNSEDLSVGRDVGVLVTPVAEVGLVSHRDPITITSIAQEITIGIGKKSIEFYNGGDKDCYYGGVGIDSTKGIPIFSGYGKIFSKVKNTFSIWLVTNGADTTTIRIVEYT